MSPAHLRQFGTSVSPGPPLSESLPSSQVTVPIKLNTSNQLVLCHRRHINTHTVKEKTSHFTTFHPTDHSCCFGACFRSLTLFDNMDLEQKEVMEDEELQLFEFCSYRPVAWRTVVDVEKLFKVSRQIKNTLQKEAKDEEEKRSGRRESLPTNFIAFCGWHSSGPSPEDQLGRPFEEQDELHLRTENRRRGGS